MCVLSLGLVEREKKEEDREREEDDESEREMCTFPNIVALGLFVLLLNLARHSANFSQLLRC